MKIDQSKLKKLVRKADGKVTAQCPACAADGGDAKGEHLVLFKDGRFGCVLYEKDKEHNRKILKLAGSDERGNGGASCRLTVNPMRVEESTVLMKVGRLGRVKPSPEEKRCDPTPQEPAAAIHPAEADQEEPPAGKRGVFIPPRISPDISDAKLREFLDLPALVS